MSRAPALVVLAGGASERLGTCKALVDLAGRTPLARLLAAGADFDGAPPLVVAGAHADLIARALPSGVELARNVRWREGRSTSAAVAARARAGFDLCLAPVDVPLVGRDVFAALVSAWSRERAPRAWLAPACEADAGTLDEHAPPVRFGHPIVIGSELAGELARALDEPAFDWNDFPLSALRARATALRSVRVASRAILDDLDTPDDLARLRAEAGARASTS